MTTGSWTHYVFPVNQGRCPCGVKFGAHDRWNLNETVWSEKGGWEHAGLPCTQVGILGLFGNKPSA